MNKRGIFFVYLQIDHKGVEDRLEKTFAKAVMDSGNKNIK